MGRDKRNSAKDINIIVKRVAHPKRRKIVFWIFKKKVLKRLMLKMQIL